MPLSSLRVFGGGISMIALTLIGSSSIPPLLTTNLRNFPEDTPKKHLRGFIRSLNFRNRSKTLRRSSRWLFFFLLLTARSSMSIQLFYAACLGRSSSWLFYMWLQDSWDQKARLYNNIPGMESWMMYLFHLLRTSWFGYILRIHPWMTFFHIRMYYQSWFRGWAAKNHLWNIPYLDPEVNTNPDLSILFCDKDNIG